MNKEWHRTQFVAYHEAGHAVAAWVQDAKLKKVTIEPSEPDEMDPGAVSTLGLCTYKGTEDDDAEIRICLAGALAVKGEYPFVDWRWGADVDYAAAWELIDERLRYTFDHYDGADKDEWRRLQRQTSKLISEHWHLIEALAVELLGRSLLDDGTMTGDEVHALFVQQKQIRYLLS